MWLKTSASVFHHSQGIDLQWQSRSCISSILGLNIETLAVSWHPRARSRDSTEDRWTNPTSTPGALESKSLEESEGQIEDFKIGAGDWLVQNFESKKDSTSVNCQVHQRVVQRYLRPTKVNRKCSVREAFIGRADQRDQSGPNKFTSQSTIMVLWTRLIMAKSLARSLVGVFQRFVGSNSLKRERWRQMTHPFWSWWHITRTLAAFFLWYLHLVSTGTCRNDQEKCPRSQYRQNRSQNVDIVRWSQAVDQKRWQKNDRKEKWKR